MGKDNQYYWLSCDMFTILCLMISVKAAFELLYFCLVHVKLYFFAGHVSLLSTLCSCSHNFWDLKERLQLQFSFTLFNSQLRQFNCDLTSDGCQIKVVTTTLAVNLHVNCVNLFQPLCIMVALKLCTVINAQLHVSAW